MQYIDLHELEALRQQTQLLNYWRACQAYWVQRANSGNPTLSARANYYAMLIDEYLQIPF